LNKSKNRLYSVFLPGTRGECITLLRKRLGITQKDLAKSTGHTRVQISKMETHERHVPEDLWIFILEGAYKVFADEGLCFHDFKVTINQMIKEQKKEVL